MTTIKIGGHSIGKDNPCFIIAEIGSNHDGKLAQAKRLIDIAKNCGADAVKIQSFKAENLVTPSHAAFTTLKKLEVPLAWHKELRNYARKKKIIFLSTPFDEERAALLDKIGVPAMKIASGDLTYHPLLRRVAKFKKPVILSTGSADIKEIMRAIAVIRKEGNNRVILLHCVSTYPPGYSDMNIRAIKTLEKKFGLPVGLSDHSLGFEVSLAAVSLGAAVIEKHITTDRRLAGPDHSYALEPGEFKEMVKNIRHIELALGDGRKKPRGSEKSERKWARRGIYASVHIPRGNTITKDQLKFVRPCINVSPAVLNKIVGKKVLADIEINEPISYRKIRV